jgi:hypothetical protein
MNAFYVFQHDMNNYSSVTHYLNLDFFYSTLIGTSELVVS